LRIEDPEKRAVELAFVAALMHELIEN
jgi:hypothetical protein